MDTSQRRAALTAGSESCRKEPLGNLKHPIGTMRYRMSEDDLDGPVE